MIYRKAIVCFNCESVRASCESKTLREDAAHKAVKPFKSEGRGVLMRAGHMVIDSELQRGLKWRICCIKAWKGRDYGESDKKN